VFEAAFGWMATPEGWIGLVTLTILEIVLGIDNVIFISITASQLPHEQQGRARRIGLFLALFLRIALLTTLVHLAQLSKPIFEIIGHPVSWRDIILVVGGFYLIYKSTIEIDAMVRARDEHAGPAKKTGVFFMVILQIAIIDVVFALDSIITAVGMTNQLPVMITAVVIAVLVMMFATEAVSAFIERYPTTKMLALCFLLMVGFALVADGSGFHIERTFLYVAIGFSLLVEVFNILASNARERAKAQVEGMGGDAV